MRQRVTREQVEQFIAAFAGSKTAAGIYLVGGVTAVLLGWRDSSLWQTTQTLNYLLTENCSISLYRRLI